MFTARRRHARGAVLALTATVALVAAAPAFAGDTGSALRPPFGAWRHMSGAIEQTVTFTKDGKVYGDAGCNRFTGTYTFTGDRIDVNPLGVTMMFCEGAMDAEAAFLDVLQSADSFLATKKTLTLTSGSDDLKLKKA